MKSMLDILKESTQDIKSALGSVSDGVDRGTTICKFVSGSVESLSAVGSYVPIVDIAGKGRLYGAIFYANAGGKPIVLKITVDGNVIHHVEVTSSSWASVAILNPSIISPVFNNSPVKSYILGVEVLSTSFDNRYIVPLSSNLIQKSIPSSNPYMCIPCIIPDFIKFEKSLKVEVVTNYDSTDNKEYGVLYDLDN